MLMVVSIHLQCSLGRVTEPEPTFHNVIAIAQISDLSKEFQAMAAQFEFG